MHSSEAIRGHLRQLTIIGVAILSGVLIFSGVVWYLLSTGDMPPEGPPFPRWMGTLFNLVALVALLKAFLLPRIFRAPAPGAPEDAVLAWHKRTTILGFALREGAAFIALVGALLTGQLVGASAMVGLAIVTMVLAWPRQDQLRTDRVGVG